MRKSDTKNKNERSKPDFDNDVDALFKLPLAEFTGARNELAARLKKSGEGDAAVTFKGLGKPSVTAWAVNQLYWNHRATFERLIESGEKFHKAQSSRSGGKVSEMRAALEARREVLTELSDIADRVLREAGHNPSPDTIHRITTTLEGISAYVSREDGPQLGRLTHDVDPPGFESVGAFVPTRQKAVVRQTARPREDAKVRTQPAVSQREKDNERKQEEAREKKVAAAKVSLQAAKKSLGEARVRARSLEAAKTRTQAELKLAEKRLKETSARALRVEEDLEESEREVEDAELAVAEATKELELLSS